ncbi:hypothetical protein EVAR_82690_1 [Eumeta japonica]|uniref:Uncharacterized protein n=1 Tax=Eumeta variegata TaxID=151549 RepID=A0A4C1VDQ3_EUMVA|nr:hypothetical protein EVAR_82690_1 [Eumeta japonica]
MSKYPLAARPSSEGGYVKKTRTALSTVGHESAIRSRSIARAPPTSERHRQFSGGTGTPKHVIITNETINYGNQLAQSGRRLSVVITWMSLILDSEQISPGMALSIGTCA